MQFKLSKSAMTLVVGIIFTGAALAHPGHAPTDTVAQIAHPLAGADHFAVFIAMTAVLLTAARFLVKARKAQLDQSTEPRQRIRSSRR
jgi:hydrogenase/urease accessory protein HupE